jgi:hypothetical protein
MKSYRQRKSVRKTLRHRRKNQKKRSLRKYKIRTRKYRGGGEVSLSKLEQIQIGDIIQFTLQNDKEVTYTNGIKVIIPKGEFMEGTVTDKSTKDISDPKYLNVDLFIDVMQYKLNKFPILNFTLHKEKNPDPTSPIEEKDEIIVNAIQKIHRGVPKKDIFNIEQGDEIIFVTTKEIIQNKTTIPKGSILRGKVKGDTVIEDANYGYKQLDLMTEEYGFLRSIKLFLYERNTDDKPFHEEDQIYIDSIFKQKDIQKSREYS